MWFWSSFGPSSTSPSPPSTISKILQIKMMSTGGATIHFVIALSRCWLEVQINAATIN